MRVAIRSTTHVQNSRALGQGVESTRSRAIRTREAAALGSKCLVALWLTRCQVRRDTSAVAGHPSGGRRAGSDGDEGHPRPDDACGRCLWSSRRPRAPIVHESVHCRLTARRSGHGTEDRPDRLRLRETRTPRYRLSRSQLTQSSRAAGSRNTEHMRLRPGADPGVIARAHGLAASTSKYLLHTIAGKGI